jgi:hypothetical protein
MENRKAIGKASVQRMLEPAHAAFAGVPAGGR